MKYFDSNIILRNNTGNKPKENLVDGFVVRTKIFSEIFKEIRSIKGKHDNYLIIGQRGAGKTTLLYRLKYALDDDNKLKDSVVSVMFSEEQYNLLDLYGLWESVADYLEDYAGFETLSQQIAELDIAYSVKENEALQLLVGRLNSNKKILTLFIENVDVFLKKIGKDGQKRLWKILIEHSNIRLICSSTFYFDSMNSQGEVFYDFFKVVQLNGLTKLESIKLLNKLAEQYNSSANIKSIIEKYPTRLESLRRLTGGNPRIISYLFQIFLDNENGKAIVDLYKLLDNITYLYKSELDQLSPQQQRIIDAIARNWDALSTKDIASKTGIEGKTVSSVLNALEKNQVVEIVSTKTKNNLYRLKDRFLNIWYLMRFGKNKERADVVWLVRFYDAWCDQKELSDHAIQYIDNLKSGSYNVSAAVDMGNVFLACTNVPQEVKYDIYRTTKSILPLNKIKELKLSRAVLYKTLKGLVKEKKFDEAIEVLDGLVKDDKFYEVASWVYYKKGEIDTSIEYLVKLYDNKPEGELAFRIAGLYATQANFNRAIQFYKLAASDDFYEAYFYLGILYTNINDTAEAEKNYRLGIQNGVNKSYNGLATLLYKNKKFEESAEILKVAIHNGDNSATLKNNLALLYYKENKIENAIAVLEESLKEGNTEAYLFLGILHLRMNRDDFSTAENLFKQAIESNDVRGYHHLAQLYLEKDDTALAKHYLLGGYDKKDAESAHTLAHLVVSEDWELAENYFLKSIQWGDVLSLRCLSKLAILNGKKDRKGVILNLFDKHKEKIIGKLLLEIIYSIILLWNNQNDKALEKLDSLNSQILFALEQDSRDSFKNKIIDDLTTFFVFLMAKHEYMEAYNLFLNTKINYKQILKPVYFSLMNFMKSQFPNEYLKAGNEFSETVDEIMNKVTHYRNLFSNN